MPSAEKNTEHLSNLPPDSETPGKVLMSQVRENGIDIRVPVKIPFGQLAETILPQLLIPTTDQTGEVIHCTQVLNRTGHLGGDRMRGKRKTLALLTGFVLVVSLYLLTVTRHVLGQEADSGRFSLDVILLIDNSNSMSDASDADGLRILAAQRLVDRMSDDAETSHLRHRVAVVSFGLGVARSTPLIELPSDIARDRIYAETIDFSDFREPLNTALQLFADDRFEPGERKAVVLLTDGRPQLTATPLTKEELEAYFSDEGDLIDIIRQLVAEDVQIYVVAIGDTDQDRSNWMNLSSKIRYLRLGSPTDVDYMVDSIVETLTGGASPPPTVPVLTVIPTSTSTPMPTPTPTATREVDANLWDNPRVLGQGLALAGVIAVAGGASWLWWGERRKREWEEKEEKLSQELIGSQMQLGTVNEEKQDVLEEWKGSQTQLGEAKKRISALTSQVQGLKELEELLEGAKESARQAGDDFEKRRGADGQFQAVIDHAVDYTSSAAEVIVPTVHEAWAERLKMWDSDLEQQRRLIYEGTRTASEPSLRVLAYLLRKRWAAQPQWALQEIYGIIENGGQLALLDFVSGRNR